jgi:ADP-ribosyl-[dinitrogen reductase] hydrolase
MTGGGPFGLSAGQWTDDTSMALCLASSLVEVGFDLRDQIDRYCRWQEHGYWSSTGRCFDIGRTVRTALDRYRRTGDPIAGPTDPRSAGNGCLMRLAPVPMFFFPDEARAAEHSALSCLTTHGTQECLDAARLFGRTLIRALAGRGKDELLSGMVLTDIVSPSVAAIGLGQFTAADESVIRGSGYVVESLEAALWCFHATSSFEAAILAAANLGDDADTTAAICGQVAGAFYGARSIPDSWLAVLHLREEITALADELYARSGASSSERPRSTSARRR